MRNLFIAPPIKSIVFLITCLMSFIFVSTSYGSLVRVIYFVPNDRTPNWNIPLSLDSTMKSVKKFYTEQMKSHGYNKTFSIETDEDSNVVVHYIAGKNNDTSYNYLNIEQEVKLRFDVTKDIFVVAADLSGGRIDDNCGFADFNGRMVIIPAGGDCVAGDKGIPLISHELGHSFNLEHDFRDDTYIMSYGAGRSKLSKCAAYALSVNPFFNNRNYIGAKSDTNIKMLTTNAYPKGHDNLKLRFSVSDIDGIHQIQFALSNPVDIASILECKDFDNTKNTTVEFRMSKSATILPANSAHIRVIDKKGDLSTKKYPLIVEGTTENKSVNPNAEYTHLTLTHNHNSSLIPTNSAAEWYGWDPMKFWEQTPEGKLGAKPWGAVPIETHIPYYDQWNYFFYSHAPSEIVYDLGSGNYERFESKFFLPNPCHNIASVELIFLADGTEIYNSGVLKGSNSQNITISFDIPRDTKEFTIKVTDAGDGDGCDHFIFADAKLIHFSETISVESQTDGETEEHTDVNSDGFVNIVDLVLVAARYGEQIVGNPNPNPDVDRDGKVDINDLILVAKAIDSANNAYNAPTSQTSAPTETALLPNYPNPFNPETWIPYHLANPSEVRITIYNTDGSIVRCLDLGYQREGYYTGQSRAAYWDGRNAVGERVASGVYFYQLQADHLSLLRKMAILK